MNSLAEFNDYTQSVIAGLEASSFMPHVKQYDPAPSQDSVFQFLSHLVILNYLENKTPDECVLQIWDVFNQVAAEVMKGGVKFNGRES